MLKNITTNTRITVVSEGCLYQGIRTDRAFCWIYAAELPTRPLVAVPTQAEFAKNLIAKSTLQKQERNLLCEKVDSLDAAALAHLIDGLKRLLLRK